MAQSSHVAGQSSATSNWMSVAEDAGWVELIGDRGPVGIAKIHQGLTECGDVCANGDAKGLKAKAGAGVLAALRKIKNSNVFSQRSFGDCELRMEFLIGRESNSGIKLQGIYEVQLFDSYGKENPGGADCGGIYPHWEFRKKKFRKRFTYTDGGHPPLVNAAKPAGQWQALRIVFEAPRFDPSGDKIRNARMELVELNGVVVQKNVELDSATGNTALAGPERALAPIMLQMDHGAIAFRNVWVLPKGNNRSR